MSTQPLRLVIADDAVLLRAGIASLLRDEGWEVIAEVGDADALERVVRENQPDVAIVDIRMPPGDGDAGIRATLRLRAELGPSLGVLVLSQYIEPAFAVRLLEDGETGIGYLLKDRVVDVAAFADAVRRVAAGGQVIDPMIVRDLLGRKRREDPLDRLTDRERDVLALMAEGRSNQSIAETLQVAPKTVEAYTSTLFDKLELEQDPADHRRVLAVLTYLRER